jgi:Fe2+ or Zn2+ uptake regulation protein
MQSRADLSHRDLILDIVRRTNQHPSADDVFMLARASVPSISLATVYRNLRRLVSEGHLRERMFGGVSRFDGHLEEHAHMVCTSCGAIVDVAADGAALVRQLDAPAPSWELMQVDVELKGRCPACRKKPELPRPSRTRHPRSRRR